MKIATSLRWHFVVALFAVATACQGPADVVASAYGDFDPNHPPQILQLSGSLPFHDPTLFHAADRYWIYGSGTGLETKSSADMLDWQAGAPIFGQNPSWIANLVPDVTDLWSPSVAYFGSLYHLYYSASVFGSDQSCIGHATASAIGSGATFDDQGSVICSNVSGQTDDFNAIDPAVFLESDVEPWLVFGSYDSGIKLIQLDASGARLGSQLVALAARSSDNPAIQEPSLFKWRDYYYLFVSFDQCCQGVNSTHNIRVGRSRQLLGPYLDQDGVDMMNGGGTLVLAGDARWPGPGSNMVYEEPGRRVNVYHAYDADNNGVNTLRIAELAFDNDGWPISAGP